MRKATAKERGTEGGGRGQPDEKQSDEAVVHVNIPDWSPLVKAPIIKAQIAVLGNPIEFLTKRDFGHS